MSPVNRAGSVSEISPRDSFLSISVLKHRCVHMRGRAGPVTEISVFATEISVTGIKIDRDETLSTKYASLSPDSGQNDMILLLYVFPLQGSMQNSYINKVTRVHRVLTVANSISLCSTIFVVFLGRSS